MRIGLIAPPWVCVPPVTYGGTETVVDNLARGLVELGHDVRLFTVGDSTCPVSRESLFDHPPQLIGTSVEEAAHVLAAYEAFRDVDVIHDHTVLGPLIAPSIAAPDIPTVVTYHGVFTAVTEPIMATVARRAAVVAVSNDQAGRAGRVPIAMVIHHGIDLEAFSPGPHGGDGGYLLFVGRMSPDKGVHRAIHVARRTRRHLVVIAKMREPMEAEYYEREVRPLLDDDVTLMFETALSTRIDLQRGAMALINPISWPEPFGLVMAEALGTGTPVLAFPNGAAPEIVDDGRTGYLCADEAEMADAVEKIHLIDRSECRRVACARFSRAHMSRAYARLYERLTSDCPRPLASAGLKTTFGSGD